MTDKEIIEFLKKGNFTLTYHDNGYCCLYAGKKSYDVLEDEEELVSFDTSDHNGYLPKEVRLLVKALSGKTETV
jgi:hypothetical protein